MDEINSKIDILRKRYPDEVSQSTLSDMEKAAKLAVMTSNLSENDVIKQIMGMYESEVSKLNKELTTNENLFKDDEGRELGKLIHARKNWCKKFLDIFTQAKSTVENQIKDLDSRIQNEN